MSNEVRVCSMPDCDEKHIQACRECTKNCDFGWYYGIWDTYDRENYSKGNSMLSQPIPVVAKAALQNGQIITVGEGRNNFCFFTASNKKQRITINDIFIREDAQGQGISKKMFEWLFNTYPEFDIYLKCIKDSPAESFWKHVGAIQIPATKNAKPDDLYEYPPNRRIMGWYRIDNPNKTKVKKSLW